MKASQLYLAQAKHKKNGVKYRDPDTGKTYIGKCKHPQWLRDNSKQVTHETSSALRIKFSLD